MSKSKKKGAIYGVIAIMLCVAVYLNWSYVQTPEDLLSAGQISSKESSDTQQSQEGEVENNNVEQSETTSETLESSDYFAQSRLSRAQSRDEAISILKDTLADAESDETTKELASNQISQMADDSVTESTIESLIKAKGYEDAVVLIGSDSVNVVVSSPEAGFTETDASKICDIVTAETTFRADQVKIVEAT